MRRQLPASHPTDAVATRPQKSAADGHSRRRHANNQDYVGPRRCGWCRDRWAARGPYAFVHFTEILVIERDLPSDDGRSRSRKGVPQARHPHALLEGGTRVEKLFPGLREELRQAGAWFSTIAPPPSYSTPIDPAPKADTSIQIHPDTDFQRHRAACSPAVAAEPTSSGNDSPTSTCCKSSHLKGSLWN